MYYYGKIITQPFMTIVEAFGMIKTKKLFSKKDYKQAISEAVIKKFKTKTSKKRL